MAPCGGVAQAGALGALASVLELMQHTTSRAEIVAAPCQYFEAGGRSHLTDNCQTQAYAGCMATITLRELARNTASVVQGIQTSGRPALVTRNGKPVVALVPIDEVALEDWLLEESADLTRSHLRGGRNGK